MDSDHDDNSQLPDLQSLIQPIDPRELELDSVLGLATVTGADIEIT